MQKRLEKLQNSEEMVDLFSKLVSSKAGYKTVIEKRKEEKKCECGQLLAGDEKFCPECGQNLQNIKKD